MTRKIEIDRKEMDRDREREKSRERSDRAAGRCRHYQLSTGDMFREGGGGRRATETASSSPGMTQGTERQG